MNRSVPIEAIRTRSERRAEVLTNYVPPGARFTVSCPNCGAHGWVEVAPGMEFGSVQTVKVVHEYGCTTKADDRVEIKATDGR